MLRAMSGCRRCQAQRISIDVVVPSPVGTSSPSWGRRWRVAPDERASAAITPVSRTLAPPLCRRRGAHGEASVYAR
ncbi:hypothetical protein XOCgx_3935 [Xanthomonas oryzae pv. oryzicola]|nr:hypothetical protein XOCgx_3935 [Xanthomonas oryzae pv. oryzicola]